MKKINKLPYSSDFFKIDYEDRLYGEIKLEKDSLEVMRTKEFRRLYDVSLSAVPPVSLNMQCSSRAEHSLGVRHLADILTKRLFDWNDWKLSVNIKFAALLHDVGSPPFSHLTESFLKDVFGKSHEEWAADVIVNSALSDIIKKYGGDVAEVIKNISGQNKPWSDLVNGSLDLDNLDNSLRFGLSMGLLKNKNYDPTGIVEKIEKRDGKLFLQEEVFEQVRKWDVCRKNVYDFVYGNKNLSSGAMIYRALSLAYERGELDNDFFGLTDGVAVEYLRNVANKDSQYLVNMAMGGQHYLLVSDLCYEKNDEDGSYKKKLSHWRFRSDLADKIAQYLSLERKEVCVMAGWDKGVKNVDWSFVGEDGSEKFFDLKRKPFFYLKVFIDSKNDQLRNVCKPGVGSIIKEISKY